MHFVHFLCIFFFGCEILNSMVQGHAKLCVVGWGWGSGLGGCAMGREMGSTCSQSRCWLLLAAAGCRRLPASGWPKPREATWLAGVIQPQTVKWATERALHRSAPPSPFPLSHSNISVSHQQQQTPSWRESRLFYLLSCYLTGGYYLEHAELAYRHWF